MIYCDILIVGGGPAGLSAAVYTSRAGLKTYVIEKSVHGGLITSSPLVQNIPGCIDVSGQEFADTLMQQAETFGAIINEFEEVTKIEKENDKFIVTTSDNVYSATSCIIASGTTPRTLHIDNEEKYIGNGISFCVTCDGPLYSGKDVIVIGGGNSAVTASLELSEIANHVTIVQNLSNLTAEKVLIDKLCAKTNITIYYSCTVENYMESYDGNLCGIIVRDTNSNRNFSLFADGIFMSIGFEPNKPFDNIGTNNSGYIITNKKCATTVDGIFACGDCTDNTAKQVSIACGMGAESAVNATNYVRGKYL